MEENNTDLCQLNLTITPLTNLSIEWVIPNETWKDLKFFFLPLVTFKYVLAEVLKVPVPLSYKTVKIENEIFECGLINSDREIISKLNCSIERDFKGYNFLKVNLEPIVRTSNNTATSLLIQYISKEIVNTDGIFFKVVFPIVNTTDKLLPVKISCNAQFSYGIRRYKFYTMCFNTSDGSKIELLQNFSVSKSGDLIKIVSDNLNLNKNDEIDLHIQATRLPFLIKKDYFWIAIFVLVILLALLPIINFFISLLK